MEFISVRIQGESDWIESDFTVKELNLLKDHKVNLSLMSDKLGMLLDRGSDMLSVEGKKEIEIVLSKYVANTEIYQRMLVSELEGLFITSYRAKPSGYITRITGAITDNLKNIAIICLQEPEIPLPDPGFVVLLKLMSRNKSYASDEYHSTSEYHRTSNLASQIGDKIEIR